MSRFDEPPYAHKASTGFDALKAYEHNLFGRMVHLKNDREYEVKRAKDDLALYASGAAYGAVQGVREWQPHALYTVGDIVRSSQNTLHRYRGGDPDASASWERLDQFVERAGLPLGQAAQASADIVRYDPRRVETDLQWLERRINEITSLVAV